MIKGEGTGVKETENIQMEGIEAGAGGIVRGIVGEEGVTEMEAITTTPRMVTITTRVIITGWYQCSFLRNQCQRHPKYSRS